MNGSKHISNCYSALQGLYWMSYGAIYTFAAVVLLDRNFTDSQVGTLIALACVFSAVFQPFAAAVFDDVDLSFDHRPYGSAVFLSTASPFRRLLCDSASAASCLPASFERIRHASAQ